MMKRIFLNNKVRHFIRIICASLVAVITSYYIASTQLPWVLLATVFVMLTPTGSALYQGLLRFFLLTSVVALGSLLFSTEALLYLRVNSIVLGAGIGIILNLIILPDRIDIEFRRTVIPLLRSYTIFYAEIVALILNGQPQNGDKVKIKVEMNLQQLPSWVYEPGFDLALQKGYRYFFMKIAHAGEILFAMHYLARYSFNLELLDHIKQPLLLTVSRVELFIAALITLLDLNKLTEGVDDFENEILEIEEVFKKTVPHSLELLDIEKTQVYFAEFIYDLKDFRNALIMLAKALR